MSVLNRVITVDGKELLLQSCFDSAIRMLYIFTDRPVTDFPLAELGLKVEQHQLFPDETNFEVVRIINRKQVEARVWERGVGETLACGSGACAIVVAGIYWGSLIIRLTYSTRWNFKSRMGY